MDEENISTPKILGAPARSVTGVQPVTLPFDLGHRQIPYLEGWQFQQRLHSEVVAGQTLPTIVLLEHEHVYTAGTRTQQSDLPPPDQPLVEVNRGGRITWHGPGQAVAYPIVPLASPVDVVAFVRRLESAVIATCADFGVDSGRVEGRSGVWITGGSGQDRKIAAIGVRVARGVAMHGVALNVNCNLSNYGRIVPCGILDAGVTSLAAEGATLPADDAVRAVGLRLGTHLREVLSWD